LTEQLHEKRYLESQLNQCQTQNAELRRRLREAEDYRYPKSSERLEAHLKSPHGPRTASENGFADDCTCGAKARLLEVMEVNAQWKRDYEILERRCQTQVNDLEKEKKVNVDLRTQKLALEAELSRLAHALGDLQQKLSAGHTHNTVQDIELIRAQLQAYQDDFHTERRDRERVQGEKDSLTEQLQTAEAIIVSLREELEVSGNDNQRLRNDKELLQQQLTAVQGGAYMLPLNAQPQLQIVYPLNGPVGSPSQQRRTPPVPTSVYAGTARPQAGGVVARGACNDPPDSFYHGGDVEVDS